MNTYQESSDRDGGSVMGRVCEVCNFDESVISFEPILDPSVEEDARCSRCGADHDITGHRI